jgi:hypothetical protein
VHTDTVYSDSQQSPETVLVLRSLANIDAGYLTRCVGKMNDAVTQAFAGGSRAPPTSNDAANVARSFTNELDSAKFDPLLVKAVARNVSACLDHMVSKVDSMVSLCSPIDTPKTLTLLRLSRTALRSRYWVRLQLPKLSPMPNWSVSCTKCRGDWKTSKANIPKGSSDYCKPLSRSALMVYCSRQ